MLLVSLDYPHLISPSITFIYSHWIDLTVARKNDLSQSRQSRQPLLTDWLLGNLFPLGYAKKTLHTIFYDAFYFNK